MAPDRPPARRVPAADAPAGVSPAPDNANPSGAHPSGDPPTISVIVPVRNDAVRLERCLRSIVANDYPRDRVEILVGDNGSTDASAQVAAGLGATVLPLGGHRVAQVRNLAAAQARGALLAFVDADHAIVDDWLAHAARASADADAVGAPYHSPPEATWVQRAVGRFRAHTPMVREGHWLGSGNLVVRRSVFTALGGFDASLETCEDVDLCLRLRTTGHRLLIDERLHSIHYGDPRTLKALFLGELWRGRDNLRVSFRHGLTLRDVPSVLMPVGALLLAAAAIVGAVLASPPLVGVGLGGLLAVTALRALRLTQNAESPRASDLAANVAVAAVYESARALALVVRATHGTRADAAPTTVPVTSSPPPGRDR